MWTVQEIVLPMGDRIYFRCGSDEFRWMSLIAIFDGLVAARCPAGNWKIAFELQKRLSMDLIFHRWPELRQEVDEISPMFHKNPHNDTSAFAILKHSRRKGATEPKDKIFALYGVFMELGIPSPPPDYGLSVEDVYRKATISCIEHDQILDVLLLAPSSHRREGLASWVPDFSDSGWDNTDSRYPMTRDRFFSSGRPTIALWDFSENKEQLTVKGKIVDSIMIRCDPIVMPVLTSTRLDLQTMMTQVAETSPALRNWAEIMEWSEYPTNVRNSEAFIRTLVSDNPQAVASAQEGDKFNQWYNYIMRDEEPITSRALPFHGLAISFSANKCFFYTENHYFGTAPDPLPVSLDAGDQIAIVSGLELPLILRPVDGGYRFITHCYVHGIMNGELWPKDETQLEDITLL
jgi:hypothetical protein